MNIFYETLLPTFLITRQDNTEKTQEKINDAIKLYHLAKTYPRKKKKKLKKEALSEYNFWKGIEKFEKVQFNFNL
jgi:hypothetical protein